MQIWGRAHPLCSAQLSCADIKTSFFCFSFHQEGLLFDWCHITGGEQANLSVTVPFPPVGITLFQDLNDLSSLEAQLALLLRFKVKQSLDLQNLQREKDTIETTVTVVCLTSVFVVVTIYAGLTPDNKVISSSQKNFQCLNNITWVLLDINLI